MSLIGDEMVNVMEANTVGSNLSQHQRTRVALAPGALDTAIVKLMRNAVLGGDPKARTTLVAPTEATLFQGHDLWFSGDRARLPNDVIKDLRATGATHLLLLSKHRSDAWLQATHGNLGVGQLEGLGYYVNHTEEMFNQQTLVNARGWLAPYAHLRLALIDLEDGRILAQQRLRASRVLVNTRPDVDPSPWNAVPNEKKLSVLLDLVHQAVDEAVPKVMAPS
ncbi:hypothetical protein HLB44_04705 [Aquincola sp. S2]|uniref:Uncharacterized protein n=1 Tax=Pseudaquabacterium terrae TaxID=2732868 RepID=A0ABX2EBX1_9BURK|nr:hypothetical protein [Aquabacterium terrae]NRF66277.1 hypothetical protein [Aquabacterium terrae]